MESLDIVEMKTPEDIEEVRSLIRAFVAWLYETFPEETEEIDYYYGPERLAAALAEVPTSFMPPQGLTFVARHGGVAVGCVSAHPFGPGIAELKRLFVLPSQRGMGLGRALFETIVARMSEWGYPTVRLDTATYLTDAIALYRRLGFVEIAPYYDLPPVAQRTTVFMELRRQGR
ncbi:GNAT family N-acetyltransferase [Frigidibacter sp. RF13]|uniref:GNAT family N-acetyltransferase n=1 Tax=Frigidibacter sp. RF13 TaxID=2997340 RepID=UPI0022703FCA|nr:GNAT family N-acetyltransferase [Frigidibacter sp. RF13]MCY1126287.1 GNAT family N-acetyltransferase [Frigidibacter sp. RF13]